MTRFKRATYGVLPLICLLIQACAPNLDYVKEDATMPKKIPQAYPLTSDDTSIWATDPEEVKADQASQPKGSTKIDATWKSFFVDTQLSGLIETALGNNQELNIVAQEINIASNEIMARQGEYLPKVGLGAQAGMEKRGEFTSQGVSDATDEYAPGKVVPEKLPIYSLGLRMSWEIDVWKKLRNATKSAVMQYLATIDGKNFLLTKVVSEIANTYYELLSLDKQLEIVKNNIQIQREALELVKLQKEAARVTSLAVKRFEAEVLKNRARQYELRQKIVQTENKLNQLVGRLPQPIARDTVDFINITPKNIEAGIPATLLSERPDVKRAERMLEAAKLDVKVAKARFYPALSIEAGAGYESFKSNHLLESPESVFYNLAGNLTAPLLNRKAIKAEYFSANSKQIQAVYDYDKAVISAYTDVVNQLSMIRNMQKTYALKLQQVSALTESVDISGILFRAARADYVEVLMVRRDALEAQMELIEVKKDLLTSYVNLYQALGGGWR